jgi:hypothetical protein
MRKFLLFFLLSTGILGAQTTSITATITDSDATLWVNATGSVTFVPNPNYPNIGSYTIGGVPILQAYPGLVNQSISTNSSGQLATTLIDNSLISPGGSKWSFVIQSNTSAPASSLPPIAVNGGSMVLTSYINANITAPRFAAYGGAGAVFGYADVEVNPKPNYGGVYYNTSTLVQRIWNGTAFVNNAGGGGGMVYPPGSGIPIVVGGASWGVTVTAPAGTVVGTTDTQTLTNKSISGAQINSGTLPHAQLPTLVSGDIPANASNTSGNAATATTATSATTAANLAGGAVGSVHYQSAAGVTATLASPTTNAHTFVYAWQPTGSPIAPIAFDLTTYLSNAISGLTAGVLPKATSATAIGNSLLDDGNTNANGLTYGGSAGLFGTAFSSTDLVNNTYVKFVTGSGGDTTCPTPAAGTSYLCTKSNSIYASLNGAAYVVISASAGTTTNALTINNSGSGVASGGTFNGASAITLSYNSIGAQQALSVTTTGTNCAVASLTTGTLNIPACSPSGGGLPTSTDKQTYYSAAGTGTATSSITTNGAATGSQITFNGQYAQIWAGPASIPTLASSCAAAATTCTLSSTTGFPTTGGFAFINNGGSFESNIIQYTGVSGATLTGITRGLFGTSDATMSSGDKVAFITQLSAASTSSYPSWIMFANGAVVANSDSSTLNGFYLNQSIFYAGGNGISSALYGFKGINTSLQVVNGSPTIQNGSGVNNWTVDTNGQKGSEGNTQAVAAGTTSFTPNGGFQVLTGTAPTSGTLITMVAQNACTTSAIVCELDILNLTTGSIVTGTSGNFNAAYTFAVGITATCWYYQTNTKWYCHV